MGGTKPKELRDYATEFALKPKERSLYGATVTAKSLRTGETRTFVRTNETAVSAVRGIVSELELLSGDWRVVSVSTPISIQRDIFASRVALHGPHRGAVDTPEHQMLGRIGRKDMLHPDLDRISDSSAS